MNYKTYEVRVYADGSKYWFKEGDGKLHREDGPAVELADGHKSWCKSGKLHRKDGPAVEYSDGTKEWYIDGEYLTKKQFNEKTKKAKKAKKAKTSCAGEIIEIRGKKYKLEEVK